MAFGDCGPESVTLDAAGSVGDAVMGGVGVDCEPGAVGFSTCVPTGAALVGVDFVEAQPATVRSIRETAIIIRRIDRSQGMPKADSPERQTKGSSFAPQT